MDNDFRPRFALIAVLAIVTLVTAGHAMAQQRTIYGADGRVIGREITDTQGARTLYGSDGKAAARQSRDGTIYDAPSGRVLGKITKDKR